MLNSKYINNETESYTDRPPILTKNSRVGMRRSASVSEAVKMKNKHPATPLTVNANFQPKVE